MLVNVLVAILVAQVACADDTANLRGRAQQGSDKKKDLQSETAPDPASRPKSNEAYVSKIFNDLKEKLGTEKAKVAGAKSELDYQGGNAPQLSFGGYFISRQRKQGSNSNWNQCDGPGTDQYKNL